MISPPQGPRQATAAHSPPAFFFLGTQSPEVPYLHPSLRATPKPEIMAALDPFVEAVFFASRRVCIMDPHFDHLHLPVLFDALIESDAEVHVLSRKDAPIAWTEACRKWIALSRRWFWQAHRCPWLHGRFALVDGDLWHFGSTVGGAYPGFDAATRWHDPALLASFQHHFDNEWGDAP